MNTNSRLPIAVLAMTLLLGCSCTKHQPARGTAVQMRALSLRVLQEKLARDGGDGNQDNNLRHLCGLSIISGYVIDDGSNDMILFGRVDSRRPPLHTEDLAVALRNAWLKYARVEGDTMYYANPGCSIDPDAAILQELHRAAGRISPGESEEVALIQWSRVCTRPQVVSIMGVPSSHFAQIMIEADYLMKKLVGGSESLKLDSFESLIDMSMAQAKAAVLQNSNARLSVQSLDRFWFYPGKIRYAEDAGIVELETCPVILLSEQEHLHGVKVMRTGQVDPLALRFAASFSTLYGRIAEEKPIYYELEGLFRMVALAKIAYHQNLQVDLNYLLSQFPVSRAAVPTRLPGISNIRRFEHRQGIPNGYRILKLRIPSCGGVDIAINVTSSDLFKDPTGNLRALGPSLLATRPSSRSLHWDFFATMAQMTAELPRQNGYFEVYGHQ
jgi:hypothetical protein